MSRTKDAAGIAVVAAVYFLAAKFGLALATDAEHVSLVWPPSGIALAAALLLGPRAWIAVAVGAFAANATSGVPLAGSVAIAAGNTAEAFAGVWILRRAGFDASLSCFRDVGGLILAALLAPTIAATVGPTTLCASLLHPWTDWGALARDWWMGDTMGLLLVAPVLLTWGARMRCGPVPPVRGAVAGEILALAAGLVFASFWVHHVGIGTDPSNPQFKYLVFPFLIWAALRFGPCGASGVTFVASAIAIWGAARDEGALRSDIVPLANLQFFLCVMSATGLFLGAAMGSRQRAEERLRADYRVGRVLVRSASLSDAAPEILRSLCETLHWDVGELWRVDEATGVLRCAERWHLETVEVPALVSATRDLTPGRGRGLLGRVWSTGRPAWVPDVAQDPEFLRQEAARADGLHGAFAFPLLAGEDVLGAMVFFSRRERRPDAELLETAAAVGHQIGQFVERRRAKDELKTSEARFRALADALPSMVWTASAEGRLTYVNRRWTEYLGAREEQIARDWPAAFVHPDDRARRVQAWEEALRERSEFSLEVRKLRHDGAWRWFLVRAVPWKDDAGRIVQWIGVTTDIHDQKVMQEQLREADRRKDEFLATLAHELRNPLAPLSNALQILRVAGHDPADRGDALALAERQLRYMVRLVDDLLDVSRITRGKIQLRRERVLLADVIERGVETSRPLIREHGHVVEWDLPAGPVEMDVDPTRIGQVISNLLNNAAKYTEAPGRIRLVARVEECDGGGRELVLRVQDTGIGIPPDALSRIFEPFMQARTSDSQTHAGLGIGLSVVKRLVEAHGGTVEAHSAGPGRGSDFVVRLPLPQPATPPQGPAPAAQRPPVVGTAGAAPDAAPRRRVLVVDDNRDSAKTMTLLLRKMGHEVATAYDGLEAVEAAGAFSPEVVLLDIGLPKLNGYEAARYIRQQPAGRGALLIALTGWGQDEDRRRSREAGFDHHLVKPLDRDALERILAATPVGAARGNTPA